MKNVLNKQMAYLDQRWCETMNAYRWKTTYMPRSTLLHFEELSRTNLEATFELIFEQLKIPISH